MEPGDIPAELSTPLLQLVVLMGLDTVNNAAHKSIWDAFVMNRRPDRLPLNFQLSTGAQPFPTFKSKLKAPGEPEQPRGLLKTNWMRKHLYEVPAVVVLFVDLDWENPQWTEKIVECSSKVKSIRHSLERRQNVKLAVVLVQSIPPLPSDAIAAQRATELCSACDLSPKALFVLPATDHLFGYALRLEHAFHELAQHYYQFETKRVKTRKESVNKISHQPLHVRYQFKLAFFNELRQDTLSALRHYKLAYQHLQEIKAGDVYLLEQKIVGGFLNYKICRICFQNNTPLDAITQFRRHIDIFKDRPGTPDLVFEHHHWMAKQFGAFSDLFDVAVQNGLAAILTQHPGFYYQSASEQAIARKTAAVRLCGHLQNASYPASAGFDPLERASEVEFYGQRPWRISGLMLGESAPQLDPNAEKLGALCLQWREARGDHLSQILHFLNASMNHFKIYRCPRMKLLIIVRMGEQYFAVGNYEKALQILSHAMWEYRREKWWLPLRTATLLALKCAYALANLKAYATLALEAMNPRLMLTENEKWRIQENLTAVLCGRTPERENLFNEESAMAYDASEMLTKIVSQWSVLLNDRCFFLAVMQNSSSCIDVTARFSTEIGRASSKIELIVYVHSTAPAPLKFSKLWLQFSNSAYDPLCVVGGQNSISTAGGADLVLMPNEVRTYSFAFYPLPQDVNTQIALLSISLDFGEVNSNVYGTLQWETANQTSLAVKPEFTACRRHLSFEFIQPRFAIAILPREAQVSLNLSYSPPALIGEKYRIGCALKNLEAVKIEGVRLRAFITEEDRMNFTAGIEGFDSGELVQEFAVIPPGNEAFIEMVVHCAQCTSDLIVHFETQYDVKILAEDGAYVIPCHCSHTEQLKIDVISPFSLHSKLMSFRGENVERLVWQEPCIISAELKCLSPDSVIIDSVSWSLAQFMRQQREDVTSKLEKFDMIAEETISLHQTVVPFLATNETFVAGYIAVRWHRNKEESKIVETVYPLLTTGIESCPVLVTCKLPPHGIVRHPFVATYTLRNQMTSILELTVCVESTEPFMFSGHKQAALRLLPESEISLKFVLLPLIAGHVPLPRLKFSCPIFAQDILDRLAQRNVPSSIFVLPFGKDTVESSRTVNSDVLTQVLVTTT